MLRLLWLKSTAGRVAVIGAGIAQPVLAAGGPQAGRWEMRAAMRSACCGRLSPTSEMTVIAGCIVLLGWKSLHSAPRVMAASAISLEPWQAARMVARCRGTGARTCFAAWAARRGFARTEFVRAGLSKHGGGSHRHVFRTGGAGKSGWLTTRVSG